MLPEGEDGSDGAGPESRHEHRRRTLKRGRVLLSSSTTLDCVIRDLTETGARLQFSAPTILPREFLLLNVTENTVRPARLVWQKAESAGISFSGPAEPPHRHR